MAMAMGGRTDRRWRVRVHRAAVTVTTVHHKRVGCKHGTEDNVVVVAACMLVCMGHCAIANLLCQRELQAQVPSKVRLKLLPGK